MGLVPGVKGYVQAEGLHEHARGSQLRHGTLRNPPWLPSIAPSALLKSASGPPPPHPSPWTRAPWHLKQCFVHCDTSSPPQCLVQCLTLRRHKINAQQMKRWMRRKRRYIQELVTTEAKVSNGGKSRKQENKDRCNLA